MYKTNRQNHDFQILYYIVGKYHTPDAAYSALCDLYEDREIAIKEADLSLVKQKLELAKYKEIMNPTELDIAEITHKEYFLSILIKNYNAAQDEITFIKKCMDRLEPYRKYSHLSLSEAHQAAQEEEWELEFIERVENYLFTIGHLPTDELATMRAHPKFSTTILPKIYTIKQMLLENKSLDEVIKLTSPHKTPIQLLEEK